MSDFLDIDPQHLRSGSSKKLVAVLLFGLGASVVFGMIILNASEQVVLSVKVPAGAVVFMDDKELSPCRLGQKCDKTKERTRPRSYKWRSNLNTVHILRVELIEGVHEQVLIVEKKPLNVLFDDNGVVVP